MYTLKGIFPEPKKEQKKNFIKENKKQLKFIQSKSPKEPKYSTKNEPLPRLTNNMGATGVNQVKSSPSNKSGKTTFNTGKTTLTNTKKKIGDVRIKKGDMAEFLKRKEMRQSHPQPEEFSDEDIQSVDSTGRLRDIGCQTVDVNLSQKLQESTKLTVLYPKKDTDDAEAKMKASGDTGHHRVSPHAARQSTTGDDFLEIDKARMGNRLNSILEKKDNKDPYLPSGYQKGVLPKYLRERKEQGIKEAEGARPDEDNAMCPPGHVTLPDSERKETLKMLRNSFGELVSELNKLPVKTDTLKMKNRKMELEKQLAKLEEGIKVFSRPKVYVKIGE